MRTLPKFYNIEFLRIIFTLCVFACHVCDKFHIINYGRFSVEFFFILSGFFLFYTIDYQKNLSDFILKKIIRFLPLMLFGEFICSLITREFNIQNFISLFFFLPATGLTKVNYFSLGTTWYVCVLFWVAIFYFYLIRTQHKETTNIIIGIITFLSYIALSKISPSYMKYLFPHYILRGFSNMGLGYFLALVYKEKNFFNKKQQNTKRCFILCGLLECFVPIYILLLLFVPWNFRIEYMHIVILFLILIFLFLLKKGFVSQFFDDNSWSQISKYCLSFFLTHLIIIDYLYPKLKFCSNISKEISVVIMLFLSIGLAILSYYIIEKPIAKYLKRILK